MDKFLASFPARAGTCPDNPHISFPTLQPYLPFCASGGAMALYGIALRLNVSRPLCVNFPQPKGSVRR